MDGGEGCSDGWGNRLDGRWLSKYLVALYVVAEARGEALNVVAAQPRQTNAARVHRRCVCIRQNGEFFWGGVHVPLLCGLHTVGESLPVSVSVSVSISVSVSVSVYLSVSLSVSLYVCVCVCVCVDVYVYVCWYIR